MRLAFEEIKREIKRVLLKYGMSEEKAEVCARTHTETAYDGVYSHGVNRVAKFARYIEQGYVNPDAEPSLEKDMGAIQVYNGNLGPGVTNAYYACDRAMELADRFGIGLVGLNNTTHWMRGGTYGIYAAKKGYIGIMWTNTEPNMPAWGGRDCRIGNNPLVIAMPSSDESEMLKLDMAMSLYSYGKLQVTRQAGKKLPFDGGYDESGNLTVDPGEIEKTSRLLPAGYWKGSGLSIMLDLLAAVLSDGKCASQISGKGNCGGCSQVFIVIDPSKTTTEEHYTEILNETAEYIRSSIPAEEGGRISLPGESAARYRADHDANGIFVDNGIWNELISM